MITAKCTRCLGSATGKTFDEASQKINHAVALSRGIPCGDNYGCVEQVKESKIRVDGVATSSDNHIPNTESKPDTKSTTTQESKSEKQKTKK